MFDWVLNAPLDNKFSKTGMILDIYRLVHVNHPILTNLVSSTISKIFASFSTSPQSGKMCLGRSSILKKPTDHKISANLRKFGFETYLLYNKTLLHYWSILVHYYCQKALVFHYFAQ